MTECARVSACMLVTKSSGFLRSFSQILLQVPVSRLRCYGDCAFSVGGPCLWNRLPESVFRRKRFYRTAPLNGFVSTDALTSIHYYYYY